jgi:hypothetical protein
VHYRTVSSSWLGYQSDYEVWLLIAGEEEFWGQKGFWLETWTRDHGEDTLYTASLLAHRAVGDSAALRQPAWFTLKTVRGVDAEGHPTVDIPIRDRSELRVAAADRGHRAAEEQGTRDRGFDSLAVDTCSLPAGHFRGPGVREVNRVTQEVMRGDSTIHYERVETRIRKLDARIPITRMAREDIRDIQTDDVWPTGESAKSTRRVLEDARGLTWLVDYGDHGLAPRVVNQLPVRPSGTVLKRITPAGVVVSTPAASGTGGSGGTSGKR